MGGLELRDFEDTRKGIFLEFDLVIDDADSSRPDNEEGDKSSVKKEVACLLNRIGFFEMPHP